MSILKCSLGLVILVVTLTNATIVDNHLAPAEAYTDIDQSTTNGQIPINKLVDTILKEVLLDEIPDSIELNDEKLHWTYRPFLITYKFGLTLTNGQLHGLEKLERAGNSTISSDDDYLTITLPLTYKKLLINYDYTLKFALSKYEGLTEGVIKNLKFTIKIKINTKTLKAELESLQFEKIREMSLKFSGNYLTDWIVNMLTKMVVPLLSPLVEEHLYDSGVNFLNELIESYNDFISKIL